ncbi:ankyrin repeat and fibronectin type-III domain-containing protein 1-like [Aplochiton taeniatus]
MSVDSDKSCMVLSPRDSRTSGLFQTAEERDDIPGVGDDSILEMLSCSKFSDLETWLCMPSTLLPRALESTRPSSCSNSSSSASSNPSNTSDSRLSTASENGETDTPHRPPEGGAMFLTPALGKNSPFLATPLAPILSSTPRSPSPVTMAMTSATSAGDSASASGVSVRKRRRLAASPGGLHWNSTGAVQRDFTVTPDPSPVSSPGPGGSAGVRSLPTGGEAVGESPEDGSVRGDRQALRKTISVDDRWLQPSGRELQSRLLGRLERGKKKLRNLHVSVPDPTGSIQIQPPWSSPLEVESSPRQLATSPAWSHFGLGVRLASLPLVQISSTLDCGAYPQPPSLSPQLHVQASAPSSMSKP